MINVHTVPQKNQNQANKKTKQKTGVYVAHWGTEASASSVRWG